MLVLLMAFATSVALALGFTAGRVYQIRSDELERGFALPPRACLVPRWEGVARQLVVLPVVCYWKGWEQRDCTSLSVYLSLSYWCLFTWYVVPFRLNRSLHPLHLQ